MVLGKKRVVPTLVTGLLKSKTIVQVAAGIFHTACLTADGLVFECGSGQWCARPAGYWGY